MGVAQIGSMVGPPLAGLAFDRLGSYQVAWFGLAGLVIVGMISLLTTPQLVVKYKSVTANIENKQSSR